MFAFLSPFSLEFLRTLHASFAGLHLNQGKMDVKTVLTMGVMEDASISLQPVEGNYNLQSYHQFT